MKTRNYTIDNLNDFHKAYMATAIWSSNTDGDEPEGYNITDESVLAPETITQMRKDCTAFLDKHAHLIANEPHPKLSGDGTDRWSHAGHDYWLTRNAHGAGFWDGDWPENGDLLSDACGWKTNFGEVYLSVGDDGLVYQY